MIAVLYSVIMCNVCVFEVYLVGGCSAFGVLESWRNVSHPVLESNSLRGETPPESPFWP